MGGIIAAPYNHFYRSVSLTNALNSVLQSLNKILCHFVNSLSAVHFRINARFLIIIDQRFRGIFIYGEAILHRLFRIVRTLEKLAAALIADSLFFGGLNLT